MKIQNKNKKQTRKIRIRSKVQGTKERPRLSVFRSNNYIYVQLIDDANGQTLVGISEFHLSAKNLKKADAAKEIGLLIAKKANEKKIKKVIFDRGSYSYHGRVKAVAEGAREGGLEF